MLAIEIIEGCNFSCYFCRARLVDKNKYMNLELFKRIVAEAKELGITQLKLTPGRGEPFLHPDVYEMLDIACSNMSNVLMYTNATPINIEKLKAINTSTLNLNISNYGMDAAKFKELTCTTDRMHRLFLERLEELKTSGIRHTIYRRDIDYQFDYMGGDDRNIAAFTSSHKCIHHQQPKIFVDGRMTFCNTLREEAPTCDSIFFVDLTCTPLHDAMTHPLRYKFFDTQAGCRKAQCTSYAQNCGSHHSLSSMKLMVQSKTKYLANPTETDLTFDAILTSIENANIQPSQQ